MTYYRGEDVSDPTTQADPTAQAAYAQYYQYYYGMYTQHGIPTHQDQRGAISSRVSAREANMLASQAALQGNQAVNSNVDYSGLNYSSQGTTTGYGNVSFGGYNLSGGGGGE